MALEVVLGEGIEDTPIHQVLGQRLGKVSHTTVVRPLIGHPVVVDVTSMRILAAAWQRNVMITTTMMIYTMIITAAMITTVIIIIMTANKNKLLKLYNNNNNNK